MNGRQVGGLIGAVGGVAFIVINAGELPGSLVWRVVGVVGFVALVATLLLRPPPAPPEPTPRAMRIYWACVIGEVLAIPVGAAILGNAGQADLVPAWVVLVVGVHFVPFARAFELPLFLRLGIAMMVIALAGMATALAGVERGVPAAAVLAGFVLFAAVWAGARADEAEPLRETVASVIPPVGRNH